MFCDEGRLKSLKKLTNKVSGEIKDTKRIDLIHFDTVLINLANNKHTVEYTPLPIEVVRQMIEIERINPIYLHKIAVNDPLLLYYGFEAY